MALACCDALDGRSRRTLRLFGQHRVLHNQPCYTNYPSNCIKLKPYPAAISINPCEPEKEKAAFLSKSGKKGGTTKTSVKNGRFKQQTIGALKHPSGDESLLQQLVY